MVRMVRGKVSETKSVYLNTHRGYSGSNKEGASNKEGVSNVENREKDFSRKICRSIQTEKV